MGEHQILPRGVCPVHRIAMTRTPSGRYICLRCECEGAHAPAISLTAAQRRRLRRFKEDEPIPPSVAERQRKREDWLRSLPLARVVSCKPYSRWDYIITDREGLWWCLDTDRMASERQRGRYYSARHHQYHIKACCVIALRKGVPRWFAPVGEECVWET